MKYTIQAKRSLELYLERGRNGIRLLKNDQIQRLQRFLRLQKAAWLNFKAAYELISDRTKKENLDLYIENRLTEILEMQDAEKEVISKYCKSLQNKANDLRKHKNQLTKYKRLPTSSSSQFEQTI